MRTTPTSVVTSIGKWVWCKGILPALSAVFAEQDGGAKEQQHHSGAQDGTQGRCRRYIVVPGVSCCGYYISGRLSGRCRAGWGVGRYRQREGPNGAVQYMKSLISINIYFERSLYEKWLRTR